MGYWWLHSTHFIKFQPQHLGFGITGTIAVLAIVQNLIINRRRATIDLIMKNGARKTSCPIDLDKFKQYDPDKLANLAKKAWEHLHTQNQISDQEQEEIKCIISVLNHYEFIACGVREGAFDYKMYHRLQRTVVLRDWDRAHSFVVALRKRADTSTLYQEFEWMANNFRKHKLKKRISLISKSPVLFITLSRHRATGISKLLFNSSLP